MTHWIGRSLLAIGILHILFGFAKYSDGLRSLFEAGVFDSIAGDPVRAHAFWFCVCGAVTALLGAVVDWCERTTGRLPPALGWSLGSIALLVVIAMPASGAWFIFVPAIGAFMHGGRADPA